MPVKITDLVIHVLTDPNQCVPVNTATVRIKDTARLLIVETQPREHPHATEWEPAAQRGLCGFIAGVWVLGGKYTVTFQDTDGKSERFIS